MLKPNKTFEQYESRLICLDALSAGNRFSNPSDDQKYIKSLHVHIGLYFYGELDDTNKAIALQKITDDYNAIKDIELKETVRILIEE